MEGFPGKMMSDKEYKDLTVKEFSKAAKVYETDDAGAYKMCKKDYPYVENARKLFRKFKKCTDFYYRMWKAGMSMDKLVV